MKKYKASKSASFGNERAQKYGERLEVIKSSKGKLQPQLVVDDAKHKDSPLHDYFDWNDKTASDKYRLEQARHMIQGICEVVVIKGKQNSVKGFFNVKDKKTKEHIYVTIKEATTEPNYKQQVLDKCINELEYITDLMRTFKKYN